MKEERLFAPNKLCFAFNELNYFFDIDAGVKRNLSEDKTFVGGKQNVRQAAVTMVAEVYPDLERSIGVFWNRVQEIKAIYYGA